MSFRFFRRIRVAPGISLNLSRSGGSLSFGPRGSKYTVGPRGTRSTVGLPGTGLHYTRTGSRARRAPPAQSPSAEDRLTLGFFRRLVTPDDEEHLVDGCRELALGSESEALRLLQQAASLTDGAFLAGLLSLKLGHAQQAAGYLDAVVRSPERLGRQFGRYGISAGASIPITDEISAHIGPDLRGALLALVEARQALAQWDEAMQCLERLRRAEPEDVLVTLSLVELLSARAANDQPVLRRILRLTQGVENETELHAGLMLYRGRALRGLGLPEAARDCLSAGLRRRKSRPDALLRALRYERALVYEGLGQRARARAEFGRLYAEDADYEDVAERLGF